MRVGRAHRHEIDESRDPLVGRKFSLEYERVGPVASFDGGGTHRRRQSAAILRSTQQCGTAGTAVEPRPAQPIDRTAARDQRGRLAVADQGIVFDPRDGAVQARHGSRRSAHCAPWHGGSAAEHFSRQLTRLRAKRYTGGVVQPTPPPGDNRCLAQSLITERPVNRPSASMPSATRPSDVQGRLRT